MKRVFKFSVLFLGVMILGISCKAQMVQTVADANKLAENKQEFIGKPLENLLKEIKPPIKRVRAIAGGGGEFNSFVFLYFVNDSEYYAYEKQTGKMPTKITVHVAEGSFDWNPFTEKPKGHRYDWTKEDEKKLGKLTVVDIRVTGSN